MKTKKILKDSFVNVHSHFSECTYVNEFSNITVGELNEAVTTNFLNKFHVINVRLYSLPEDVDTNVTKFVKYCNSHFSAVLIQSYLLSSCNISLLFNRSMSIKSAIYWLDDYKKVHNVSLDY